MSKDAPYSQQFIISYELLCLLQWIVEHDAERIKKLITKALSAGLKAETMNTACYRDQDPEVEEYMHQSIIDFFSMMEALLDQALHEHTMQKATQKNLLPALDHIDTTICDDATVRFSLEKAAHARTRNNSNEAAQEILFKELLKRWKPNKKSIVH